MEMGDRECDRGHDLLLVISLSLVVLSWGCATCSCADWKAALVLKILILVSPKWEILPSTI